MLDKIKSKLKSNSANILYLNMVTMFFMFIQSLIVVRLLSLDDYGKISIIMAFILFLQNIIGMRTGELVLKYIHKDSKSDKIFPAIKKILFIDIKLGIFLYAFVFFVAFLLKDNFHIDMNIFVFLDFILLFSIGFLVFESLFIIFDNMLIQFKLKLTNSFFNLIFISISTYLYGLYGYLVALLFGYLFRTLLYGYFAFKELKKNNIEINNKNEALVFEDFWSFTKHSYLSTTFKSGIGSLDIILLSMALKPSDIALYKVAKNLASIPGAFLGSLWSSINPKILEHSRKSDYKNLFKLINKFTIPFLVILIVLLFPLFYLSDNLFIFLYGNKYQESSMPFMILFIGFWLSYTFAPFSRIYYLGQNKMYMVSILNGFTFFNILIFGYLFRNNYIYVSLIMAITIIIVSLYIYTDIYIKSKKVIK